MAYWIHESGNKNNYLWRFFMCDSISNINDLPTAQKEGIPQKNDSVSKYRCSPGSQCLCLEDRSIWILGKENDRWVKTGNASSGSYEGITEDNVIPISSSSIKSLFQ